MGGTLAKLSVSALMFDYILTGPISGVSAGQYIVSLFAQTASHFAYAWAPSKERINLLAASLAVLVTLYFWWRNTKGIHESSHGALKIMYDDGDGGAADWVMRVNDSDKAQHAALAAGAGAGPPHVQSRCRWVAAQNHARRFAATAD
jgi:hypothetical protein